MSISVSRSVKVSLVAAVIVVCACKKESLSEVKNENAVVTQPAAAPLPTFNGTFDPLGCNLAGPQTPRDVSAGAVDGTNLLTVPKSERTLLRDGMRICNVHFHLNAEHRSAGQYDENKAGQGWACRAAPGTTAGSPVHQTAPYPAANETGDHKTETVDTGEHKTDAITPAHQTGGGASSHSSSKAGDTVEFHWVHTTCEPKFINDAIKAALDKGEESGLAPCACPGAKLVVEARVFRLTETGGIGSLSNRGPTEAAGSLVRFFGSTTGPKYNGSCSPVQVGWNVDNSCTDLNLSALKDWLQRDPDKNKDAEPGAKVFNESHGHGVRELVTDPSSLSPFTR